MNLTPSMVLYPDGRGHPHAVADIDWATALVRFHIPWEDYSRLLQAQGRSEELSEGDLFVLEGLVHECFHLMQFLTTGYAYHLSTRFLVRVVEAAAKAESLEGVYERRAGLSEDLRRAFGELTALGPGDVTTLDLLESSAFMFQKRSWGSLNPISYQELLDRQAPARPYRHAYDVAVTMLGPGGAWTWFNQVVSLALKTKRPQDVYVALLEVFRRHAQGRPDANGAIGRDPGEWAHNHRLGMVTLQHVAQDWLIGEPLDLMRAGLRHPLLSPAVERLDGLVSKGVFDPLAFAVRPHEFGSDLARLMNESPKLFPPSVAHPEAQVWRPQDWVEGSDAVDVRTLMHLCAVSILLTMEVDVFPS